MAKAPAARVVTRTMIEVFMLDILEGMLAIDGGLNVVGRKGVLTALRIE